MGDGWEEERQLPGPSPAPGHCSSAGAEWEGQRKRDFLPSCDRRGDNQRVAFSTPTLLSINIMSAGHWEKGLKDPRIVHNFCILQAPKTALRQT